MKVRTFTFQYTDHEFYSTAILSHTTKNLFVGKSWTAEDAEKQVAEFRDFIAAINPSVTFEHENVDRRKESA